MAGNARCRRDPALLEFGQKERGIMSPTFPTPQPLPHDGFLEIHLLGIVDFEAALFLQERLVYEISGRTDLQAGLLLCEHPPLITIGREGSRDQIVASPRDLAAKQIETRWLNRGGGAIVHGPGQLAVYPILPLDRLEVGLTEYRRRLEECVIKMAGELQVLANRHPQIPGVWCRLGQFAHLGVAVKSWVSYHGLFIDVEPKVDSDRLVRPHETGERATSLSVQCGKLVSMNTVRESLSRHLAEQFGYTRTHVDTGHPLLRRETRKIFVDA